MRRMLSAVLIALMANQVSAADSYPDTIRVGDRPAEVDPAVRHNDIWITTAIGSYDAKNYPEGSATTPEGTHVGGGAVSVAATWAGNRGGYLVRLKSSYLTDFTSNTAEEVGLLVGAALADSRKVWASVGVARLTDVSNHRQSPTVGVPVELLWFPIRGLEVSVFGDFNDDRDFGGFTVGWAIGRHKPG